MSKIARKFNEQELNLFLKNTWSEVIEEVFFNSLVNHPSKEDENFMVVENDSEIDVIMYQAVRYALGVETADKYYPRKQVKSGDLRNNSVEPGVIPEIVEEGLTEVFGGVDTVDVIGEWGYSDSFAICDSCYTATRRHSLLNFNNFFHYRGYCFCYRCVQNEKDIADIYINEYLIGHDKAPGRFSKGIRYDDMIKNREKFRDRGFEMAGEIFDEAKEKYISDDLRFPKRSDNARDLFEKYSDNYDIIFDIYLAHRSEIRYHLWLRSKNYEVGI